MKLDSEIAYTLGIVQGDNLYIRTYSLGQKFKAIAEEIKHVARNVSYDLSNLVVAERVQFDGRALQREPVDVAVLVKEFKSELKNLNLKHSV